MTDVACREVAAPALTWDIRHFRELDTTTLYAVLALRSRVFVVEQVCPYLDVDGLDFQAIQVLGWSGRTLIACARILPLNVLEPGVVSIGRVAVAHQMRGRGFGRAIMREALNALARLGSTAPIKIIAQQYLEEFYRSFGFEPIGPTFIHDGQPHVPMVRL